MPPRLVETYFISFRPSPQRLGQQLVVQSPLPDDAPGLRLMMVGADGMPGTSTPLEGSGTGGPLGPFGIAVMKSLCGFDRSKTPSPFTSNGDASRRLPSRASSSMIHPRPP